MHSCWSYLNWSLIKEDQKYKEFTNRPSLLLHVYGTVGCSWIKYMYNVITNCHISRSQYNVLAAANMNQFRPSRGKVPNSVVTMTTYTITDWQFYSIQCTNTHECQAQICSRSKSFWY